jgi:hypothetical protein
MRTVSSDQRSVSQLRRAEIRALVASRGWTRDVESYAAYLVHNGLMIAHAETRLYRALAMEMTPATDG